MTTRKITVIALVRHFFFLLLFLFSFSFLSHGTTQHVYAATLPSGFQETTLASGIVAPVALAFAPDGRIFITEKGGNIRVYKNGSLLSQSFASVSVATSNERGLLGIAFDPDYATNRYVYVYYTRSTPTIKNRVSRFTASLSNPDVAEVGSETIILDEINSDTGIHNGGAIHFGTDGKLYVAIGDSGNSAYAQNLNSLSGKLLRINKDGSIPTDNPFVGQSGKRGEIWAYGFRNPFTFAIHPTNSKIYVNDVGEASWEEVDDVQSGGNYGWPTCEGTCSNASFINPIATYSHSVGHSITGGTFYTGTQFPAEYQGQYFFADYVDNFIKRLDSQNAQLNFATGTNGLVDLQMGADGALYHLSINTGQLFKISYGSGIPTPTPTATPTPTPAGQAPVGTITLPEETLTYNAGDTISYAGTATDAEDGTLPASGYRWDISFQHGTHVHPFLTNITGSTTGTFTIPTTGEVSSDTWYRIQLTVTDSSGQTHVTTRDIHPNTASLTFATQPAGLTLNIDGQPKTTPYTVTGVVGFTRSIEAPNQTVNGRQYAFASWSDTGSQTHSITTPATNTTYTAVFTDVGPAEQSQLIIKAAGQAADGVYPTMELLIKDEVVQTYTNIQGDATNRVFQTLSYTYNGLLAPADVKMRFANDYYGGSGNDRNLRIDSLTINEQTFQTEGTTAYSTGTWSSSTGCAAGNKNSEWLHCPGYFTFTDTTIVPPVNSTPTPTPTATSTPTPTPTNTPTPTPTTTGVQKITNGSFENGFTNWNFNVFGGAGTNAIDTTTKVDGANSAKVVVTTASPNKWYIQLNQNPIPVTAGKTYAVSFWAKADKTANIQNDIQRYGGNWQVYSTKTISLNTTWQQYTYTFVPTITESVSFTFNLAETAATYWIDKVSLIEQ